MADLDLPTLQQKRANALKAGDQAAVARYDQRIQQMQPGGAEGIPAAGTPFPTDPPPPGSTGTGMLKSVATGLRNIGESIVSAPGDLVDWEARQVEKIAPALGRTWRTGQDNPTHGPGIATTPDVQAATDTAVKAVLPEGGAAAVEDITRHKPQGMAEEYTQTAAEFLPMLLTPGSWPAKIARTLIPAASTETAGQVAREVAPDYETAVRLVTGFLTTAGAAKGAPNFATRRAMKQIADAGPEAVKRVQDRLIADGMAPEEAAARMRELGPSATPMDVGPNLRQEGQQTMARGGEGRAVIDRALREREAGANERLQPDIRANVGPEVDRMQTLQALKDRAAEVGKQYPDVKKNQPGGATDLQGIDDALASEMAVVKDNELLGTLDKIRRSLKMRGTDEMDPSAEGLHAAREAIDNQLYKPDGSPRDMGGKQAAALKRYRGMIDDELARVAPDIKALDEEYSGIKREGDAFETGEQLLDKGRSTLSPDEFQRTYDAMTPGEQAHIKSGMTREIDRLTGVNINDRVKLKNLISGDDPASWNFGKIKTVIGEENATRLMSALEREATFNETYQKVIQGSKTAETLPQDMPRKPGVVDAASDMLLGGGPGKLKQLAKEKLLGGDPSVPPEVSAQVARLVTSNRPDDLVDLARLLKDFVPLNAGSGDIVRALMSRQHDVSERKQR